MKQSTRTNQTSRIFIFSGAVLVKVLSAAVKLERAGGGFRLFDYQLQLPLPMRLTHVCSSFREVVLATPSLWNIIDTEAFPSPTVLDAYLKRSQDAILDIKITADYLNPGRFRQLVPHVNRWGRLSITGDDGCEDMFMDVLEEIRTLKAPQLTHLKIDTGCEEIDVNSVSATFTGGTPSLVSLDLNTYSFLLPPNRQGLKSLSLYNKPGYTPSTNYEEFCDALKSMSSLVDLRINGEMAPRWPSLRASKSIPSLRLKYLRVSPSEDYDRHEEGLPDHYLSSLLLTLGTNSLQYFSLSNVSDEIFASFLKSLQNGLFSFPNVKWLAWSVDLDETEEEDLDLITRSFPAVETFNLTYFSEDHSFLQFLAENPTAWPKLRSVNVRDVNIPVLCDLVAARLQIEQPIKDAWVEKRRAPDDDKDVIWLKNNLRLQTGPFDGLPTWRSGWE